MDRIRASLSLLVLLAASGCGGPQKIRGAGLSEGSGLVQSRRTPGTFWTHNDSTDGPCPGDTRLFALDARGVILRTVTVLDSCNVDWEDIATDDAGNLYVADFGNNKSAREDLVIYRVPEPAPEVRTVRPSARIKLRYAEQTERPDPALRYDAESLFWAPGPDGRGTLYLLTKRRKDMRTVLYRLDDLSGAREITPTRVGDFLLGGDPARFGGMATAADATPDGRYLALLSYHAIFVFERPEQGDNYLARPVSRIDLEQDVTVQAEAIAWDGDALVFTNEGGAIFRVEAPLKSGRFPRPE